MNNQKEGIDCTSNANQNDSIDDTHNVNQNNSSTENIDFEINEFKKLLQNCTYNVFGIDLKKYITKEPENCFLSLCAIQRQRLNRSYYRQKNQDQQHQLVYILSLTQVMNY